MCECLKKWVLQFNTRTGRTGYAVIYAPTVNSASTILKNLGAYREEQYIISNTIEEIVPDLEYRVVLEGATPTLAEYFEVGEPDLIRIVLLLSSIDKAINNK